MPMRVRTGREAGGQVPGTPFVSGRGAESEGEEAASDKGAAAIRRTRRGTRGEELAVPPSPLLLRRPGGCGSSSLHTLWPGCS